MKKLTILILALFILGGCALTGKEIKLETTGQKEHTKRVIAEAEAAVSIAEVCKPDGMSVADCVANDGTVKIECVAVVAMSNAMMAAGQTDCVKAVAATAGSVAVQVPQMRRAAIADMTESIFGKWLNNNTGVIVGGLVGIRAVDAVAETSGYMRDVAVLAGRPDINNSVTTYDNDIVESFNEANGNSSVTNTGGDGSAVGSPGANVGDQDNDIITDNRECGDDCRFDSPGDNFDDQQNNEPEPPVLDPNPTPINPGDDDGQCLTLIWSEEAQAIDPDC